MSEASPDARCKGQWELDDYTRENPIWEYNQARPGTEYSGSTANVPAKAALAFAMGAMGASPDLDLSSR